MEKPVMRLMWEEDLGALKEFLTRDEIWHKHAVKMENLDWMILTTLRSKHLGYCLVSENDHGMTGFIMASYEFSDWRSGLCHWVQVAVGLTDEIEQENSKFLAHTFCPSQGNCIGMTAVYDKTQEEWMNRNFNPTFELQSSHYFLFEMKVKD